MGATVSRSECGPPCVPAHRAHVNMRRRRAAKNQRISPAQLTPRAHAARSRRDVALLRVAAVVHGEHGEFLVVIELLGDGVEQRVALEQ